MAHQTKELLTQKYDLLANSFHLIYLAGKERGRKAMALAMDKAHHQLIESGEFSAEQGTELQQYMARDLDQTIADIEHLGDTAMDKLNPCRLGVGALSSLSAVLNIAGTNLHSLKDKTGKKLSFKTAEVTSAGTLTCQSCGQSLHLKATSHVPPCPKCKATLFSKGN
jgi:isocitrate dehydrogenase